MEDGIFKVPSPDLQTEVNRVAAMAREEQVTHVFSFGGYATGFGNMEEMCINLGSIIRMFRKKLGDDQMRKIVANIMSKQGQIDIAEARENEEQK